MTASAPAAVANAGVVVRTEPLVTGGSGLAEAALTGAAPGEWYPDRPRDAAGWAARAAAVRASADSGWLDELWPAIEATGAAAERLRRAADHGVILTTGQQPGLFGGPLYTWAKAIAALALADALERVCGLPVAPVFWAATDDTDLAEASTTWLAVPGGVERVTAFPAAAPGTVLAAAPLGDLSLPLASLAIASGSASYGAALEAVRAAYQRRDGQGPPVTAGGGFVQLLRAILAPPGVAVLDAAHGAVRRRAFPLLRRALERADAVQAALVDRSRAIVAAGYAPQVTDIDALSLVFAWDAGAGNSVSAGGPPPLGARKSRVSRARAAEMAGRAGPGDLSPNVLLRPVVERSIMPTVAYVAGPGELAYFAQSSAVAGVLDAPAPLAVPRWSCTIIEPAIAELMTRYAVTLDELRDPQGAERRLVRAALPPSVDAALASLRAATERGIDAVQSADVAGLVPPSALEGTRVQLRHRLTRLERRFLAAVQRAEVATMRDLATVRGAVIPNGKRQERVLNFIPFLARGGPEVLGAMQTAAAEHAAVIVGGGPSPPR